MLRRSAQYVRAVLECAERDEFFLTRDTGPAFFGTEFVFPLVLLVGGEVEEGLASFE
jgi:hypothetical protein